MTLTTQPLRVLHVLGSGQLGGIERVACDLCGAQLESGEVIPSVLFRTGGGPYVEVLAKLGVEFTELGAPAWLGFSPSAFRKARLASRTNDIVHLHSFIPPLLFPLLSTGTPIVFHEHGVFGQGRRVLIRDRIKRCMKARFLRHSVAVSVANSRYSSGWAATLYGLKGREPLVIHNGISLGQFRAALSSRHHRPPGHDSPLVIGTIGRLVRFKRFDRLLKAVALVADERCHVLMLGDGPERGALTRLARDLGITGQVEFVGSTTDVPSYLRRMDMFMLPSAEEPFGLVVVEALAAGLPVVVFADSGGPAEILTSLGCGRIVSNEAELAEVIQDAVTSKATPATCNIEDIENEYSVEIMSQRFLAVYRNALSRK